MMNKYRLFYFGWIDLDPADAADMGCDQVGRWKWQGFHIGLFGIGIIVALRAKPLTS